MHTLLDFRWMGEALKLLDISKRGGESFTWERSGVWSRETLSVVCSAR